MLFNYTPEFIEKFWSRVDRSGGPDACWPWIAGCSGNGYGHVVIERKNRLTHRIAADLSGIDIDGQDCLHTCDNPPCCNPKHLFPGNDQDNMRDMVRKGRAPVYGYYGTPMPGESNPQAKLTQVQVDEIRSLKGKEKQCLMAKRFGVSTGTISMILKGKTLTK